MNKLGPMLLALFLEPQHCGPELLLVQFDLPLSLGSKCPVQLVPVTRRDGFLGSMFLPIPAGNISLDEFKPNFSVLSAYLRRFNLNLSLEERFRTKYIAIVKVNILTNCSGLWTFISIERTRG